MRLCLVISACCLFQVIGFAQSDYSRRPRDSWPSWIVGVPGYTLTPDDGKPFYSQLVYATNGFGFVMDGVTDNSAAMTNVYNAAPNNSSIILPAGICKITNFIVLNKTKNVEFVGVGPVGGGYKSGKTFLLLSAGLPNGNLNNGAPIIVGGDATRTAVLVTNGFSRGSSNLVVNTTVGLSVGQIGRFYETNDNLNFVLANYPYQFWDGGGTGACDPLHQTNKWGVFESDLSFCSNSFGHQAQVFRITGITGNTVNISAPIYFPNYALSNVPTAEFFANAAVGCGFKNMVVNYSGVADYITLFGIADQCWWVSCVSSNSNHAHIQLLDAYNIFVHGNGTLGHSVMDSNAREGIGCGPYVSDSLIENNYFELGNLSHKSQLMCSGNVFAYNFSHMGWVTNASNPTIDGSVFCPIASIHGDNSVYELTEGNVEPQGGSDDVWAGSAICTYFRNWFARDGWSGLTANIRFNQGGQAFYVDHTNWLMSAIGNVWGTSRDTGDANANHFVVSLGFARSKQPTPNLPPSNPDDTNVSKTIFYHGNFDYVSGGIQYSNGITHSVSNSMYLLSKPSWFGSLPWPIGADQTQTSSFNQNVITNANSISNIFIPAQVLEFFGTNLVASAGSQGTISVTGNVKVSGNVTIR